MPPPKPEIRHSQWLRQQGKFKLRHYRIFGSGLLCTRTYSEVGSVLEVPFSAFTTEREFRLGQNYRAHDFIAGNLRSQEYFPVQKLIRVGEFHELTASTDICPFILHLFGLALVSHALFLRYSFRPPLVLLPQDNDSK
jgi:hypothetical protein